jgi:archaeoflavoprotein AfpA
MGATDKQKRRKVAWGLSGAGDKIAEILEIMKGVKTEYENTVEMHVFLSKAAETVMKFYGLEEDLRKSFQKVYVESHANSPFLAGWMQLHKYEFLLIAPGTSNTVAKIALGIGDTMLTNAASMSLKAFVPVYIMPVDYEEKTVYTKLPNGEDMKLRIRKEDADNVRRLKLMEDVYVLEDPQKIPAVFEKWFGSNQST